MSMPIPLSSRHGREIWRKAINDDIDYNTTHDDGCNNYFCNHARQLLLESLDILDDMQLRAEKAESALKSNETHILSELS